MIKILKKKEMPEDKMSKIMKLSDFYGALKNTDFPCSSEIREVMQDEE